VALAKLPSWSSGERFGRCRRCHGPGVGCWKRPCRHPRPRQRRLGGSAYGAQPIAADERGNVSCQRVHRDRDCGCTTTHDRPAHAAAKRGPNTLGRANSTPRQAEWFRRAIQPPRLEICQEGRCKEQRIALDSYIREHLWMYLAFRLVPVYLVGVFIAVIVERAKGSVPLALTIMTVAHLALTNGRSMVLLLRSRTSRRMQTLLIYNSVVVVVVVLTTVAAGLTFRRWDGLVPNPSDLVVAAWAGVFAAILAISAQRLVRFRGENGEEVLGQAKRDIGSSPWQYAEEAAERQATDPLLVQAILAAEALQRPRWIRRLERTKGRIFPRETYGVAEVASDQPLSDQESIDRLCSSWTGFFPERDSYGNVDDARLAARLEQHNSNPGFVHSAIDFYRQLQPQPIAQSERTSRDHRPVIEVNRISRRGQTWELSPAVAVVI
jgi:hypothetical protein